MEIPEYEIYVFGKKTFVIPVKRRSRREKIVSNNIETLFQKYTYNYKVETEGNMLTIRVSIEVYSVISRGCPRKLERINRRVGFTQVSVEIMEQT